MQETWVQSLGGEDPLEKGKATPPVFWPAEFHGLYSPWGCKESDTTEQLSLSLTETRKMVAFYIEGKRWTIIVSIQQSNHIPIAKLKCCELIFKFEEK